MDIKFLQSYMFLPINTSNLTCFLLTMDSLLGAVTVKDKFNVVSSDREYVENMIKELEVEVKNSKEKLEKLKAKLSDLIVEETFLDDGELFKKFVVSVDIMSCKKGIWEEEDKLLKSQHDLRKNKVYLDALKCTETILAQELENE